MMNCSNSASLYHQLLFISCNKRNEQMETDVRKRLLWYPPHRATGCICPL